MYFSQTTSFVIPFGIDADVFKSRILDINANRLAKVLVPLIGYADNKQAVINSSELNSMHITVKHEGHMLTTQQVKDIKDVLRTVELLIPSTHIALFMPLKDKIIDILYNVPVVENKVQ